MSSTAVGFPEVVSRAEWVKARKALLAEEKALTRQADALSAKRRRLPMVKVDKEYVFEGPKGRATLLELFEGRRQLIVYHFMLDPDGPVPGAEGPPRSEGCPGCSQVADCLPHLAHVHARDTSFTMVSRARLEKIAGFKARMGWNVPWVSSFGSDFNYDFHVTIDEAVAPFEYNYASKGELAARGQTWFNSVRETAGLSAFVRDGDEVFHTYSAYARGLETLLTTQKMLDLTAFGRQEEWEDSPEGWPQTPTGQWLRHHDKYGAEACKTGCACGLK